MAKLFRKILVPHDFSSSATKALKLAVELAEEKAGRVTALHVLTPLYSGPGYPTRDEIAWTPPAEMIRKRTLDLEAIVKKALGWHADIVTCRVVMGEAGPAILEAARHADTIIMGTLGRTGLAHLLLGSVAEKIVRLSPIPVVTVRLRNRKPAPTKSSAGRR